jgi:hypothetical protein
VAALSLAVNPALTNIELATILEKSADDIGAPGYDTSFGWGRVNALNAVTAARQTLVGPELAEKPPALPMPVLHRRKL